MLIKVVRNPLDALPPQVYHAPVVHNVFLGRSAFTSWTPPSSRRRWSATPMR
jgi:hypothetical protein